jgi:prepilin-type N-terminal cleavage/methylation domain-containing protein
VIAGGCGRRIGHVMHARPTAPARRARSDRSAGFTLIELVMVMVVIGVMAVFVLPRALDLTDWRLRAFGDELQAQTMAMQRLALTQRRPVVATFSPTGASFAYVAGGTLVTLPCPAAASPCITEAGSRTVTFNADNSGRSTTSTGSALAVTVASGDTSRRFVIEAETGLFRPLP